MMTCRSAVAVFGLVTGLAPVALLSAELTLQEATDLSNDVTTSIAYVQVDGAIDEASVFELLDASLDLVGGLELEIEAGTLSLSVDDVEFPDEVEGEDAQDFADSDLLDGLSDVQFLCAENQPDCISFTTLDGTGDDSFDGLSLWGSGDEVEDVQDTIADLQPQGEGGN